MNKVKTVVLFIGISSLQACSVPVDLGKGSVLGEGGIPSTRAVLRTEGVTGGVDAFITTESSESKKSDLKMKVDQALTQDFADTLAACNKVFAGYENQASNLKWTSFGIAMVGTVAGAVIVPALAASAAAHKVAIAAWGGLSGAANSAQNILNQQGLSAQDVVKTREQIRTRFEDAMAAYFDPKNGEDARIAALQKAAVACVSYAIQSSSTQVQGGSK
ncbi:hypothetical protein [Burkholderia ubonensis]|uniref:hypothetical protein n=1 Tax=Burkholderia ubonensis TaxID=101571 RepID=UPI000A6825E4|nr:hypothetical protein [Burkholderia ubonensis]